MVYEGDIPVIKILLFGIAAGVIEVETPGLGRITVLPLLILNEVPAKDKVEVDETE